MAITPTFLIFFLLISGHSALAATATSTPTNCTNAAGIGTQTWTNPGRAISSNNSYATASVDGTTTNYLECQDYGFAIPLSATINGITVNVERKSNRTNNGGSHDAAMRIVQNGTIGATNRATTTTYTTSDVTEPHGSATDLWGLAWTPADINAATFGAAFAATKQDSAGNPHTISVDMIQITVNYTPDTTPPVVSSINRASVNPSGNTTVSWTVVFSESVTGVDAGDFTLIQAGGVSGASITSVTGSGTTYAVTANTGSGSGTLGLNLVDNDSIIDPANNRLGGTGAGNGNFTGQVYTLDKTNPQISSINLASANPTNATTVSWTVTFTESVTGVDAGDFSLIQAGGVSGANITSISGSGATWTVTANTGSGSGTLGLNLVDNDTIIDVVSRPLGGTGLGNANFTGQIYTLDKINPAVVSINHTDPSPTTAKSVSWTVIFNKSVNGVDISDFVLAPSGLSGAFLFAVTGSGTTWTVTANTGIGSGSLGLNLTDDDSIIGAFGVPLGGTGTGNGNFTGQIYTITATPPLSLYSMDETSWNGTLDEVTDSENAYPGTAKNSATTTDGTRAIPSNPGTCRYGVFDNGTTITKGYVELPDFPDMTTDFTITAWIKTTDNTVTGQRIFLDDETNSGGYGFSLGDGGAGKLRFFSRGITPIILDSTYTIANNTWYFVAAVADITNKKRTIYVFDSAGTLLNATSEAAWTGGAWGADIGVASIGGETNSSGEPPTPTSFHFKGYLDEVSIYDKILNQAAVTALAKQTHACSAPIDHYELSLPTNSVTCVATTDISVTACADSSSPCTNKYAGVGGQTAALTASGGALTPPPPTPVTFDATGVAHASLSYPAATDGTAVSVTLSGEQTTAQTSRKCCPDGTDCVVANSCTTTFKTAGFIFAAAQNGATTTLPNQVAGTGSSTYYLRAVKTNTTTKACEAALAETTAVDFAYECNNPGTCSSSNLMAVNGGTSTIIARNNNGSVSSYTSVNMTFDANGNAPFTFNYNDVGQVQLYAKKLPGGSLLSSLTGSSNAFVVKPGGVVLSGIKRTSDNLSNPGAVDATGAKFAKAGESFTATVTSTTSGGVATPNFGKESTPEGVRLDSTLAAGLGLTTNPSIDFTTGFGTFSGGSATGTDFTWGEAGIITLTPYIKDGDYLGAGDVTGTTSGNVGRFYPDHFTMTSSAITTRNALSCAPASSFTYMGETIGTSFTLEARNAANTKTRNYISDGTPAKNFAKLDGATASKWTAYGINDSLGLWGIGTMQVPYAACKSIFATATPFSTTYSAGVPTCPTSPSSPIAQSPIAPRITVPTSPAPSGSWATGTGTFGASLVVGRAAVADGSYQVNLGVAPQDADGVILLPATLDLDADNSGVNERRSLGQTALRYGRLRLPNAYGPETAPIIMPARLEYYNGTAFTLNTQDSCTNPGDTTLYRLDNTLESNQTDSTIAITGTASTTLTIPNTTATAGLINLRFSPLVAKNVGYTDVTALIDSSAPSLSFLQYKWDGITDTNPTGRINFGIYRGNDRIINWREIIR